MVDCSIGELWKQMDRKIKPLDLPFFLLLIGIYPAISLLGDNISEVNPSVVARPLIFSVLLAAVFFSASLAVFRSLRKAAVFTAVLLIVFFSYGHLILFTSQVTGRGGSLKLHLLLLSLLSCIVLAAFLILWRTKDRLSGLVRIINISSAALLVLPLFQIVDYTVRDASSHPFQAQEVASARANPLPGGNSSPDVYYIILDMYSRDDVLEQVYGMDNQPFLDRLSSLGFYVGRCSQSNYSQTQLSLSSSLNMNYLQSLIDLPEDSSDRTRLDELIEHNAVRKYLQGKGYQTISLSAYVPLRIESAAGYISTDQQDLPYSPDEGRINAFEALFIQNSALVLLTEMPQTKDLPLIKEINYPYSLHIHQQLFILDMLKKIPAMPGPKFVFAHVQIPHPPYVFGPGGEIVEDPPPFPYNPAKPVPEERAKALYRDQVTFINAQMIEIVETILDSASTPPVIVLQGDHGAPLDMRMPVLNAYYLPRDQEQDLYPEISPVNTFRLILNQNFGESFKLLPDVAYDSSYQKPFLYTPAQDQREGCRDAGQ